MVQRCIPTVSGPMKSAWLICLLLLVFQTDHAARADITDVESHQPWGDPGHGWLRYR